MKYIVFVFTLLLFVSSCNKEFDIINLNGNQITVLGHGGMGIEHLYPLNSFESIQNCLSVGADGTELDVQMTKDSVLIVFHHALLEQSTNMNGKIYEQNYADIKEATYKDPPYARYQVVTLDELFSNLINPKDFIYFLDCKNFDPDNSTTYLNRFNNALIKVVEEHDLSENIYVEFKRKELILSLKNKRPDYKISFLNSFELALPFSIEQNIDAITVAYNAITVEEVAEAHANGIQIAVFNTHSKKRNIEAIEKNVDFIQTDKVNYLVKLLK